MVMVMAHHTGHMRVGGGSSLLFLSQPLNNGQQHHNLGLGHLPTCHARTHARTLAAPHALPTKRTRGRACSSCWGHRLLVCHTLTYTRACCSLLLLLQAEGLKAMEALARTLRAAI